MKNLLSSKVFGRTLYTYNLLIAFTAMVFIGLFVFQVINKKNYEENLENYTEQYITYLELSPEKVKDQLTQKIQTLDWKELDRIKKSIIIKSEKINNDHPSWSKFINTNKRLDSLLLNIKDKDSQTIKNNLLEKIESLNDYVRKNNWRRLTRESERVQNLLDQESLNTEILANANKDLEQIKIVTERSLLSNYEKSSILARISKITELNDLEELLSTQKSISSVLSAYTEHLSNWYASIGEDLIKKRQSFSNQSLYQNIFLMAAILFIALLALSLSWSKNSLLSKQDRIEEEFDAVLNGILFEKNQYNANSFQESFKKNIEGTQDHLYRRMHFGQVVEQGIPFPSLLIDKNLKITWMNSLAQTKLGLDFNFSESKYLSWDHIKQFTSFNDFDPVLDGIKFNNGGVFDTHLNLKDGSKDKAEFFISPVKLEDQSYVFVSFQVQSYYQEVLENNKQSIINPVKDTLNYLATEKFENTEIIKKKMAFDSTDTKEIYPLFERVVNRYIEAIVSLKEALEMSCEDNKQKENELHALINSKEVNIKAMMAQTNNFKTLRQNISELDQVVMDNFAEIGKLQSVLSSHIEKTYTQQSRFHQVRSDIKKIKENTSSFKNRLHEKKNITSDIRGQKIEISHMVNQLTGQSDNPELSIKLNSLITNLEEMDNFYRDLDVSLGKLEYYFEELNSADSDLEYNVESFKVSLEKEFYKIDQMEEQFEALLDSFAGNLESQFTVLKDHKMIFNHTENRSATLDNASEIS